MRRDEERDYEWVFPRGVRLGGPHGLPDRGQPGCRPRKSPRRRSSSCSRSGPRSLTTSGPRLGPQGGGADGRAARRTMSGPAIGVSCVRSPVPPSEPPMPDPDVAARWRRWRRCSGLRWRSTTWRTGRCSRCPPVAGVRVDREAAPVPSPGAGPGRCSARGGHRRCPLTNACASACPATPVGLDPDVEALLESTLARRRGRRVRWAGAAVGVLAAACAATALVVSGWWPGNRSLPNVPAEGTTSSVTLEGRFAGEVAALPAAPSVAGRWVLEFKPRGVSRLVHRRPTRAWSQGCSTPSSAGSCAPTCSARTSARASRSADTPSREPVPPSP